MKLFCDENVGTKVPSALQHIGVPCDAILRPNRSGPIRFGMSDLEWLPIAGTEGYLVVTHDLHMLEVPAEREALVAAGLGVVFIDAGIADRWRVLRLLLDHWEWLERVDSTESRPFAFRLPFRGRPRAVPLP